MLAELGCGDLESFVAEVVPPDILLPPELAGQGLPQGCDEAQALAELAQIAAANQTCRSLIGLGYAATVTPALLQRHVFENPAWYTAYTPYQAEIAQGRLEALLNFQTLIAELTGLPIANASLLDEGTAAAEAMGLSFSACRQPQARRFLVDVDLFPQTLAVLRTRAEPLGIVLESVDPAALLAAIETAAPGAAPETAAPGDVDPFAGVFGLLLQLPGLLGPAHLDLLRRCP
jgi:glycine dehydrogenase